MRSVRKRLPESESDEDDDESHYKRDLVEELIGEEIEDEHTHRPEGTFEILNELVVDRGPNPSKFIVSFLDSIKPLFHYFCWKMRLLT